MSNRPTFIAYAVTDRGEDKKANWREIGAVWAHKDGQGFNLKLDLLPINGAEIVLRKRKADDKPADTFEAEAAKEAA